MRKLNIFNDENLDNRDVISILIYIMIISGVFGFIYEEIFYRFDLGYFVKRGATFGPIIPIYVYGGLLITLFTYRYKNNPMIVFLINFLLTGIFEYFSGYIILKIFNLRLWNYNTEILNYFNIDGFVCLRSVLFFAISSLLLIYIIIPFIFKIYEKYSKNKLYVISYILIIIYMLDRISYILIK
ncbi:MAG: hypothetical protein E7158_02670 [Firmicutes bacterium]|nr:hypothetical protein [Bacillota bacterium]